ncbi:MAG: ABC transporter ATP-binding protein [Chloroflexi bacterium]|nr:ABC transporter ATP-binding protein [Chloroflexota bacterium]MBV9897215.1 ABC transporter ATP-binding protein [Chloroflexota bacterium]
MIVYHGPGGRGPRGRRSRREAAARVGLSDHTNGTTQPTEPILEPAPRLTPGALWDNTRTTWHGFRRVLALVWDANPGLTLALALLNLVQGAVPAARVWLSKLLVDAVVGAVSSGNGTAALPQVMLLVALQFGIGAASNVLGTAANICQQLLQEQVSNRIQLLVMRHANQLDLVFFERPQFYDLLQTVQREAAYRPVQMVQTAFMLIRQILTFVSLLALLVNLEWFIAAAALISPIPAFVSSARYGWQGYQMMRWQSPLRRMMGYLTNLLTTDIYNKEVKLFTLGDFFIDRFSKLFGRYYAEMRGLVIRRYVAGAVWSMLTVLTSGLTFLYVAFRTLGGTISVGGLTMYVQAADGVSNAFSTVLGALQSMYEHQLYLQTLFELLDFKPQVQAPEHPIAVRRPIEQGIEFRNVTYTYEGKDQPAIDNVSFTIRKGETVAIVGHNGAGKTTLVKLLARLYDPQEGQILIDGHDVREYDPDALRNEFGVLFQDYVSYQFSARENIGVGRIERLDDATAITDAATKSGASTVIEGLPQGYETVLGKWFEGGVNLSGGEWQKVALGRAFMREAQILILDEPSAALDARAEYELFSRLQELAHGRTAIFISHRFSTVRRADRILVFEEGRLIESGTHEELVALGGRYAELFNLQAASYR